MSLRPLTLLGAPVLRTIAQSVVDATAEAIQRLAQDMAETMMVERGVGLAAPQVGISQRLIVFYVPESRAEDSEDVPLQILINPSFVPLTIEMVSGLEGCLSLPGLRGMVPRYRHIGYAGLDLTGHKIEREAVGFHARVVQHEIDHLDGVMYLDRMADFTSLTHESVLRRKIQQEAEEANAQSKNPS
ncbi:MAG: peptide deformylase [Alphaproteobacteria bacterium]|nr:peptide deformylase [Alphaproteobacteria bacterium]